MIEESFDVEQYFAERIKRGEENAKRKKQYLESVNGQPPLEHKEERVGSYMLQYDWQVHDDFEYIAVQDNCCWCRENGYRYCLHYRGDNFSEILSSLNTIAEEQRYPNVDQYHQLHTIELPIIVKCAIAGEIDCTQKYIGVSFMEWLKCNLPKGHNDDANEYIKSLKESIALAKWEEKYDALRELKHRMRSFLPAIERGLNMPAIADIAEEHPYPALLNMKIASHWMLGLLNNLKDYPKLNFLW
jgi:hypothetical protein